MSEDKDELAERMRLFTAQFVARSVARREALAAARQRLTRGEGGADARGEIMQVAHSLAGTAGLFGFDEIGQLARRIDDDSRDGAVSDASIAALCGELIALLDALPVQRG